MSQDIKAGGAFVELFLKDKQFRDRLKGVGGQLAGFASKAAIVGAAMAAAGAAAVGASLRGFIAYGDSLDKAAKRTGLSVEALSRFGHAAKLAGTDITAVEKAAFGLSRAMFDARRGSKEAQDAFAMLGVDIEELSRMSVDDQFRAMAEALAGVEDASIRGALAQRVMGRAGRQILPMVDGLAEAEKHADALGITMSTETAAGAANLLDALTDLWTTLKQVSIAMGVAVAPLLESVLPIVQQFATMALQGMTMMRDGVATAVGDMMSFLIQTVLTVLEEVTFAWNNWALLVDIAITSAYLSVVRFANQVVYLFSEIIPGWLVWLADNWREIFTDFANITATVAANIWKNLVELFDAIRGLFSGEGFDFNWTPLTEGFESAIKEFPEIAKREMGPLERQLQRELDGLSQKLVTEREQHAKDFAAVVEQFIPTDLAQKVGDAATAAAGGAGDFEIGGSKANTQKIFSTFSAAAAAAAGGVGGKKPEDKIVDAIQEADDKQAARDDRLKDAIDAGGGALGP